MNRNNSQVVAMKLILSTVLLVGILLSCLKALEPSMHTIEARNAPTEPENYANDSVAAAFALNTTGDLVASASVQYTTRDSVASFFALNTTEVPVLTTTGDHPCEKLTCSRDEKCFVGSLFCEYRFCPLVAFCERKDEEIHLGPKSCDKVYCEPGYDCALRKVSSNPNNPAMVARCIINESLVGDENPKLCDDRYCRGLSCIQVEKQCDKHFCGYIDKCVGIEEMLPWADTCKQMNCLRDGDVCYKGIEDPFCHGEDCEMKTKCQRYFVEPNPCKNFECPRGTQCTWKKPWCDFSPCPYMVYCARTLMDTLGGPMACDEVYCSPGFECVHDLKIYCPYATCLRRANCLRKECKAMTCKKGMMCTAMKSKCEKEDPCPIIAFCTNVDGEFMFGPSSCNYARCSNGYQCFEKLTSCAGAKCKIEVKCVKHDPALPIREVIKSCKDMPCKQGYECVMKPKKQCKDPPCSSLGDDIFQPYCKDSRWKILITQPKN